jgi:hypothetical protein
LSKKTLRRAPAAPSQFDQARDEMFSHILRCGVIEALPEHQKDWFDDTMQYIAERYTGLTDQERSQLRVLGERYCQPVQRAAAVEVAAPATEDVTETEEVASSNA